MTTKSMNAIISVEGNIGSGKSTLLQNLSGLVDAILVKEPVDVWSTIMDKSGETMLQKFYREPEKYALYNSIKDKKFEYIIHGLIIFLIGCVGFLTTENISPFCNYAFMTETSTFFLNLRPLKIAMIDFGFIGTFIFYRLVLFPWITYYYIDNLYAKMLGIGFFTLNLYWFVLIAKKSYKTYLKGKAT